MKDKIELYKEYSIINLECSSCYEPTHLINECPNLHYFIATEDVVKQLTRAETNFRNHFKRNANRKRFNYKNDITLIQSSALALREIIFILKEEGIKEKYRIDLVIEDFIDENPEGFPVQKKMEDFNKASLIKKNFSFMSEKSHDLFEKNLFDEKISNSALILPRKKSTYVNILVEEELIIDSFSIDKIESFTNYFTHNNFGEIVKITNICAEHKLETIINPELINGKQEEFKKMIKITKSKTIKQRKTVISPQNDRSKEKSEIKENEKKNKNNTKPTPLQNVKKRFSIFGRREPRIEKNDKESFVINLKATHISNNEKDINDMSPLMNSPKVKTENISKDNYEEASNETPKTSKFLLAKNERKKRQSTSCDGNYHVEGLLNKASLEQLEKMIKLKKEQLNNE